MDDAARDRPLRDRPLVAAPCDRAVPVAGHPRAHAGHPIFPARERRAPDRGRLWGADAIRRLGPEVRGRSAALSAARTGFLHGIRDRPQRRREYLERWGDPLPGVLDARSLAQADRDRGRVRHVDVRARIRRASRLVVAVGGRLVGQGAQRAPRAPLDHRAGGLHAVGRGDGLFDPCVQPARAVALAQDRDSHSEPAHRVRPDRRGLGRPPMRRRRPLLASARARAHRLSGVRGHLHHRHCRRHHQQCAGRRRGVRVRFAAPLQGSAAR